MRMQCLANGLRVQLRRPPLRPPSSTARGPAPVLAVTTVGAGPRPPTARASTGAFVSGCFNGSLQQALKFHCRSNISQGLARSLIESTSDFVERRLREV